VVGQRGDQRRLLPIAYESLKEVGSILGSGGMIVTDGASCMVDVARFGGGRTYG
jgi:NADH:ubiquinone oxidoreductase subunit F (NADH-binding)